MVCLGLECLKMWGGDLCGRGCLEATPIRNLGKQEQAEGNVDLHCGYNRGFTPSCKELWSRDSLSELSHLCFFPLIHDMNFFYITILYLFESRNFTET